MAEPMGRNGRMKALLANDGQSRWWERWWREIRSWFWFHPVTATLIEFEEDE